VIISPSYRTEGFYLPSRLLGNGELLFCFILATIAGLGSFFVIPLYTEGDGAVYLSFYDEVSGLGIIEAYAYQVLAYSSAEPIHAVSTYLFSRFFSHEQYIGLTSFVTAFLFANCLLRLNYSKIFVVVFLLANSYMLVLYLPGERLKLAFILFLIGLSFFLRNKNNYGYVFVFLSILAHVQMSLFIICGLFYSLSPILSRVFIYGRVKFWVVGVSLALFLVALVLSDYVIEKVMAYYRSAYVYSSRAGISDILKPAVFLFLSLFTQLEKKTVLLSFLPLILAATVVSSDRITMVAYFLFLFFCSKGSIYTKLFLIVLSLYYFLKSISFIDNLLKYGTAFPDSTVIRG